MFLVCTVPQGQCQVILNVIRHATWLTGQSANVYANIPQMEVGGCCGTCIVAILLESSLNYRA